MGFRDAHNQSCSHWLGTGCNASDASLEYTSAELINVRANCPSCCGLTPPVAHSYQGAVARSDHVVFAPSDASRVGMFDFENGFTTGTADLGGAEGKYCGAAMSVDNVVIFAAARASRIALLHQTPLPPPSPPSPPAPPPTPPVQPPSPPPPRDLLRVGEAGLTLAEAVSRAQHNLTGLPVEISIPQGSHTLPTVTLTSSFVASSIQLVGVSGAIVLAEAQTLFTLALGAPPLSLYMLSLRGRIAVSGGSLRLDNCSSLGALTGAADDAAQGGTSGRRLASRALRRLQSGGSGDASQAGSALDMSGGEVFVTHSNLSGFLSSAFIVKGGVLQLSHSRVANNYASSGGGMRMTGGLVFISHSLFEDNVANVSGGALHVRSGTVQLSDQTLFRGNRVNSPNGGSTFFIDQGASVEYTMPAPLGRWILATHDATARLDYGTWSSDYPFACTPGIVGRSLNPDDQSQPGCSGLCPAGYSCAAPATTIPELCPRGHFCVEGTITPMACSAGTFSNATGATDEDSCKACPRGSYCLAGSAQPQACPVDTFGPEEGSTSRDTGCQSCQHHMVTPVEGAVNESECICDASKGMVELPPDSSSRLKCGCPQGEFLSSGRAGCMPCPSGTSSFLGSPGCST